MSCAFPTLFPTGAAGGHTIEGEINSILSSAIFHKCKLCNSKVDNLDDKLGRCTKCKALLKLTKCPLTTFAKILISDEVGYDDTLTSFEPVLTQIAGTSTSQEDLERTLIMNPPRKFRVSNCNIVFGVETLSNHTMS